MGFTTYSRPSSSSINSTICVQVELGAPKSVMGIFSHGARSWDWHGYFQTDDATM